jgi:hypothetical protein
MLDHIREKFKYFETVRFPILREFARTETGTGKVRRRALKNLVTQSQ